MFSIISPGLDSTLFTLYTLHLTTCNQLQILQANQMQIQPAILPQCNAYQLRQHCIVIVYKFKYYTLHTQAKQYAVELEIRLFCFSFSCQASIRKKIVVSGFFTVTASSHPTVNIYSFLRPALNKTYIHKHTP